MSSSPLVSIVVITFNRSALLRRALESLNETTVGSDFTCELVVVDNASTDDTQQVIEELSRTFQFPCRYVREPQGGTPFARNCGIANAHGEWIAFFDDDQLAAKDWLMQLYATAQEHNVLCVGGARDLLIEPPIPSDALAPYTRELLGEVLDPNLQRFRLKFLPNTGNVIIHRSVFETVGRFNEAAIAGGEDSEFFRRMIDQKIEAIYQPKSLVTHLIGPHRINPAFILWLAYRIGIDYGHRDIKRLGRMRAIMLSIARIGKAVVIDLPKLCYATITGNTADQLALKSKLNLLKGYLLLVRSPGKLKELSVKFLDRGKG